MAKVRARKDNNLLFMDFYYRGIRCREQTALPDTAENRNRVQVLMNRISKEIKQGFFDYAATFPNSTKAARFATTPAGEGPSTTATVLPPDASTAHPVPHTPTFSEFSITWRSEMAPQWRRNSGP